MPGAILLATLCLAGAGTAPVTKDGTARALLQGVAVSRPGCADRVVFRFAKRVPAYRVAYQPAARAKTEDGSGRRLPLAGRAFLVVRFTNTTTTAEPRRVAGGQALHVREAARTGAFEAVVTWAIGLDAKRPFTVRIAGGSLVVSIG